jgi:hypothetical protein
MPNGASRSALLPSLLLAAALSAAEAQQPAAAVGAPATPAVGDLAPDFAIRGATRFGLLKDPVRLSDFRGQTVVLWLFIKARTRG